MGQLVVGRLLDETATLDASVGVLVSEPVLGMSEVLNGGVAVPYTALLVGSVVTQGVLDSEGRLVGISEEFQVGLVVSDEVLIVITVLMVDKGVLVE